MCEINTVRIVFAHAAVHGDYPDSHVLDRLTTVLGELRKAADLRWSPASNLHITTRFIGNWPDERLPELERLLAGIRFPAPLPISVAGFGYFPDPQHPRAVFAAVRAGPELAELVGCTDAALESAGLRAEERPYTPHVTLARIGREDIGELRRTIAGMAEAGFGNFLAREFHLYRSTPSAAGSVYTRVSTYAVREDKSC